jgi:hypothetical protein
MRPAVEGITMTASKANEPRCESESGGILGAPRVQGTETATHVHIDLYFGDHRHCAAHACPSCCLIADAAQGALTNRPTFA